MTAKKAALTIAETMKLLGLSHPRSTNDLVARGKLSKAEGVARLDSESACVDGASVHAYLANRKSRGEAVVASNRAPKESAKKASKKKAKAPTSKIAKAVITDAKKIVAKKEAT